MDKSQNKNSENEFKRNSNGERAAHTTINEILGVPLPIKLRFQIAVRSIVIGALTWANYKWPKDITIEPLFIIPTSESDKCFIEIFSQAVQ